MSGAQRRAIDWISGDDNKVSRCSDVDFLEESSTVFITAGSIGFNLKEYSPEKIQKEWMKNVIETRIIEVDKNRNVLFEMIFSAMHALNRYERQTSDEHDPK